MPAHIIHAIYYTYNKAHTHMHAYRGQTHTRTSMTLTRMYTRIHAYTHVYTHTDDTESRGDPAKRGHSRHARHKFSKVISRVDWCGKYTRGLTLADCCRIAAALLCACILYLCAIAVSCICAEYLSPEILLGQEHSFGVDWCVSVCVCPRLHYRLLTLCPAPTDPVGQSWPRGTGSVGRAYCMW